MSFEGKEKKNKTIDYLTKFLSRSRLTYTSGPEAHNHVQSYGTALATIQVNCHGANNVVFSVTPLNHFPSQLCWPSQNAAFWLSGLEQRISKQLHHLSVDGGYRWVWTTGSYSPSSKALLHGSWWYWQPQLTASRPHKGGDWFLSLLDEWQSVAPQMTKLEPLHSFSLVSAGFDGDYFEKDSIIMIWNYDMIFIVMRLFATSPHRPPPAWWSK